MKRKLVSMLVMLTLVGTMVTGCGGTATESTESTDSTGETTESVEETASSDEKIQLSILGYKTGSEQEVIDVLIEKFEEENPDIDVTYEGVSSTGGYSDVLNSRLASGQGDDIFFANATDIMGLVDAGYTRDLSDLECVSNYKTDVLDAITLRDQIPGLTMEVSLFGMFTNQDLLDELGLEVPETQEEFLATCEKVQEAGYTAIEASSKDGTGAAVFITANGFSELYASDDSAEQLAQINEGEILLGDVLEPGFEALQEILDGGYINPEIALVNAIDVEGISAFASGETAFYMGGNWLIGGIQGANADLNFTFEGIPTDSGAVVLNNTVPFLCINSDTDKEEAAIRFIEFMMSTENNDIYVAAQNAFSVLQDGTSTQEPAMAPATEVFETGTTYPWSVVSFEYFNNWSLAKEYGSNQLAGVSVEESVAATNKAVEDIMKLK